MKKTIAIILTLTFILSMFPMNVFAAKESFIKITEVTVNEVSAPAAGTEVQFSANCTTQYVTVASVKWYESKNVSDIGTALTSGAKFKPGYYYTVSVELKNNNSAYYFDGNGSAVTATLNGKAATASDLPTLSAQGMLVNYTFQMCLGVVSLFEFTLDAPTAGAAPHYPRLTGVGYSANNSRNNGAAYKNGIYWLNETDNKVLYPDENPKFEAGKKYSANVTVTTSTGYRVSTSPTVKVNGTKVSATRIDNECITFKVEFTVPKAHTHTSSEWKTDATNHWKVCTDTTCGVTTSAKEAHKDQNKDNKCDVCSYAIPQTVNPTTKPSGAIQAPVNSSVPTATNNQPATTTPPVEDATQAPDDETQAPADATQAPADEPKATEDTADKGNNDKKDDSKNDKKNNGALIWIIIGAVAVLAAGGVIVFVVLKKKKAK